MLFRILLTAASFWFISVGSIHSKMFSWQLGQRRTPETYLNALKDIFNRSHMPSCDLTANMCDTNCCSDQDCQPSETAVFKCEETVEITDPFLSDPNFCYFPNSNPVFCYEYENSPYIGDFFPDDKIKESKLEVENAINSAPRFENDFVKERNDLDYKYGSPLLFLNKKTGFPEVFITIGPILGYCSDTPIRYLQDQNSNCVQQISEINCENNSIFNHKSFLGPNSILQLLSGVNKTPIKITVKTSFFENGTDYLYVTKNTEIKTNEKSFSSDKETPFYNQTNGFCENVLIKLNYVFLYDKRRITELLISFTLANVPVSKSHFNFKSKNEIVYLRQSFNVAFESVDKKNLAPSGYHLLKPLSLFIQSPESKNCTKGKCKSKSNSSKIWTKDKTRGKEPYLTVQNYPAEHLKSFGGEGCQSEEKIGFGYDVLKSCLMKFDPDVSCGEKREMVLKLFQKYLNFEAVSDGFGGSVPHIRERFEYGENYLEENSTECNIPSGIQFRVLYSTLANKFSRFKIVGFHSRLKSGICTEDKCVLNWSLFFSEAKPKSLESSIWMREIPNLIFQYPEIPENMRETPERFLKVDKLYDVAHRLFVFVVQHFFKLN